MKCISYSLHLSSMTSFPMIEKEIEGDLTKLSKSPGSWRLFRKFIHSVILDHFSITGPYSFVNPITCSWIFFFEVSNKVLWKRSPDERVGVMAKAGGNWTVAEYSELDAQRCNLRSDDGKLLFGAGNICNHYFSVPFLREVANSPLPYHIAKKKIPCRGDVWNVACWTN